MRHLNAILISLMLLFSSFCSEAAMIKTKKANVRSAPGLDKKVLFVYRTNAPLEVLEAQGKWLKVRDFENEVGWVSSKVVSIEKRGAIVKVANANVRRGPSLRDSVVFLAGYGVAFEVIKSEDDWLQIKHEDGDIGWIQDALVFSPQSIASSQNGTTQPDNTPSNP